MIRILLDRQLLSRMQFFLYFLIFKHIPHSLISHRHYTHPSPFAEVSLFISSSQVSSVGRTHHQSSHAAPYWSITHPTELSRTLLSYVPPCWATLHPSELRRILLSYAAPFWAALHPPGLRWTLLSFAAPYWAKPYSQSCYVALQLSHAAPFRIMWD